MNREIKPWKCKNGHIMGLTQRDGNGIRVLMLYREALTDAGPSLIRDITLTPYPSPMNGRGEADLNEVDVMAIVEGYVADVRCSICGAVRTWVPGQEQLDRLIERVMAGRVKQI